MFLSKPTTMTNLLLVGGRRFAAGCVSTTSYKSDGQLVAPSGLGSTYGHISGFAH